ncbi:MAG TPA: DUF998 domain-containing protein [Caulobacteraceae bacterium]|jgi:hypothetical protein
MHGDALAGGLPHWMLLAGPATALAFAAGVTWLGWLRPGYSAVRQTISELGPLGGKGRRSLAWLNLVVALGALAFALGLASTARLSAVTVAPAWFVGAWAGLTAGLAAFPSGHRLHNVFGLLQTVPFIGAPLAVAQGWRALGAAPALSWIGLALLVAAMALNLAPAFSRSLAARLAPVYGLAQRALFASWHGWCAALGVLLYVRG